MEASKEPNTVTSESGQTRSDEATSDEQLSDLEATQTSRAGEGSATASAADTTHAPDGAPEASRGDGHEGSEPM